MTQGIETRRVQLGRMVKERRLSLGMSKDAAAAAVHMSTVTWSRVEDGQTVRDLTYFGVAKVLSWPHSACLNFLERGEEPVPDEDVVISEVTVDPTASSSQDVQPPKITLRGDVLAELDAMQPAELSALIVRAAELISAKTETDPQASNDQ